jgi:NAD(P)-dependent dehydrogenase (short-subunit alcohol dehydrogenase family)
MSVSIKLDGRVILVCGAGRGGIGGATAIRLAEAGAIIAAVDKTQAILDETIAVIKGMGKQCHGFVADLMDPAQTEGLVEKIVTQLGRLDGVVNVAGGTRIGEFKPLEETSNDEYRATFSLNVDYVFRICRDAANAMIKRGLPGAFVNFGSVSSLNTAPLHSPYGAAKSGVTFLSRTMALEWGKHGIRVNTVHPGMTLTERVKVQRTKANPSGNDDDLGLVWTMPEEVANTVLFLLSDLASGISGQDIAVDSALTTKYFGGVIPFKMTKRNPQP